MTTENSRPAGTGRPRVSQERPHTSAQDAQDASAEPPAGDFNLGGRGPRRGGHIRFNRWIATNLDVLEQDQADPSLKLPVRILCAAQARMNAIGHAQFAPGELSGILSNAEGVVCDSGNLRCAVRSLVDRGLLEAGSGERCLIVPKRRHHSGASKNHKCLHHGI